MKSAIFEKDGNKIKATAIGSAGMGFLSRLIGSGWYNEAECYDLCNEYSGVYVEVEIL